MPSRACICDELAVDDVGQPAAQAAHRLHAGLAVGEPAPVIPAAFGVVAQLHDPGHIQDVVDAPVPGPRQAVADVLPAGSVDGRGPGPGREVAAVGEPGDVACAAKSAEWSLTNALRLELAPQGTKVTALHVGYMDTDMTRQLDVAKADPAAIAKLAIDGIEAGEPEIIADETSNRVLAGLSAGVAGLYPQVA